MPRISVIMGVYNIRDTKIAEDAIQSILTQTYTDFEFIICDDGSTNNTYEFLKEIKRKDRRIKLLRNKVNRGLAFSLNHCLKICKGEYIARMDIDDISYNNRLEKQLYFLDTHPQYAVVGSWASLFTDNNNDIWGIRKKNRVPVRKDFLFGPPLIHATMLIRKSVLDDIGRYRVQWDTTRAEDYELFMRLYGKGFQIYNIQEPLYSIREDNNAYKRRKYRHRIEEAHVRFVGFRDMGLLPVGIPYILKPLIVGIIPQRILRIARKEDV